MPVRYHGYYGGTFRAGRFGPFGRVMGGGLFARGNGRYRIDPDGIHFKRFLLAPIHIPHDQIEAVDLARGVGGWLIFRNNVSRVTWLRDDGSRVVSGFVFSNILADNDGRLARIHAAILGGFAFED